MKFVVDSSIIVKWLSVSNEQHIEKADKLLSDSLQGNVELFAPELAKYEVGNVLLKGKQLATKEAFISLGTAYALPITFVSESEEIAKNTYSIAVSSSITYYDAAFISLAEQYGASLITENIKHQGKTQNIKVISLTDY
ncbi:hypothetical protein COV24_00430 [candidate division WWE3 bacterium CG10_big_fil_rev_8_21_14_0_10_32_10]|uniref:PIN domain-containing protein n=1 Tax=candidate division WWE3 bacterium CG10_big_fil_rev_8_21_14_0_10_32_10 TaxID=1975090 RepID=A0A2H0RBF6_UNCKA|nr:MAG: hypothetical protein COV24_00430 [candidate division WWE3 bacterium CG10_big_fil_rev_8_21_14_0_10_32_10]